MTEHADSQPPTAAEVEESFARLDTLIRDADRGNTAHFTFADRTALTSLRGLATRQKMRGPQPQPYVIASAVVGLIAATILIFLIIDLWN